MVKKNEESKKEFVKIKNRFTDEIIFESTKETLREAVLEAISKKANLSEANLSRANLSRANLSEANLSRANLSEADLSKADLSRANLSKADLSWANLSRANLSEANLSRANLSEAYCWKTNFKYNKITKKTKEQILEIMQFKDVEEERKS